MAKCTYKEVDKLVSVLTRDKVKGLLDESDKNLVLLIYIYIDNSVKIVINPNKEVYPYIIGNTEWLNTALRNYFNKKNKGKLKEEIYKTVNKGLGKLEDIDKIITAVTYCEKKRGTCTIISKETLREILSKFGTKLTIDTMENKNGTKYYSIISANSYAELYIDEGDLDERGFITLRVGTRSMKHPITDKDGLLGELNKMQRDYSDIYDLVNVIIVTGDKVINNYKKTYNIVSSLSKK